MRLILCTGLITRGVTIHIFLLKIPGMGLLVEDARVLDECSIVLITARAELVIVELNLTH